MARIVITGSNGFIGTTLREHFHEDSDHEIVGLDRAPPKEAFPEQTLDLCDLLHRDRLEELLRWYQPDHVLHMAAQARVGPSMDDPLATYDLNVRATLNVLDACQATRVPHLVVASSEAIYGDARQFPTAENSDFRPINPYAASKVAADVLTQQFNRTNVDTCVARSGMGWGPRSNPAEQVVAKFIIQSLQDDTLKFPRGDVVHPTRDLNYVKDFARGINAIVDQHATGVYNLSGGREYSVLEIAENIVSHTGLGEVAFTDEFEYREGEEGFRTWMDVSKAAEDLGHKPKYHLEPGSPALEEAVNWYKEHIDGSYWDN